MMISTGFYSSMNLVGCPKPDVPIVTFHRDSKSGSSGLGVLISRDLVLTCEHVLAGGPKGFCDVLSDELPLFKIRGAYLEDGDALIPPKSFQHITGRRRRIDPYGERLAIVLIEHKHAMLKPAVLNFDRPRAKPASLTTVYGSRKNPGGCVVYKVGFSALSPYFGTNLCCTEWYRSEPPLVIQGDSGGGFFDASGTLVSIQNALLTFQGQSKALAIPVARAGDWINHMVQFSGG